REGDGKGLLEALADDACLVVTDEFPCFFLPRMVAAAGARLDVRLEAVDSNGILPLRASDRAFPTAYRFRRHLQKVVAEHLDAFPEADPLDAAAELPRASFPDAIAERWPAVPDAALSGDDPDFLANLPIDHDVAPVDYRGGAEAADAVL